MFWKLVKDAWGFMMSNKFIIPAVSILFAFGLQNVWFSKESIIDANLESGTKPPVLKNLVHLDRSDKVELLCKRFIQQTQTNMFGVVLGPTGTGKTYVTRLACNHHPEGVLYFDISDPNFFPERLARKIGMRLVDDTNLVDILIEKVGISKVNFYRLPQELPLAMSYVLDTLAERGIIFRKLHDRTPCLFLDGVDLLAKKYPEVFVTLIDLAKHYANNGMLRIVFVGRDGLLPLLDTTSSQLWQADIIEVLDIDRESAEEYLTRNGLPTILAERVFNFTGGRFALLNKAIDIHATKAGFSEDDVFGYISARLVAQCYGNKLNSSMYNETTILLDWILQSNDELYISMIHPFLRVNKTLRDALKKTLFDLIELNMLRYTANGAVTWHSEVVRNEFIRRYKAFQSCMADQEKR